VSEILKEIRGVAFLSRTKVSTPQDVIRTKKQIKKAFIAQLKGIGYGIVEVLSTCPTNWGLTPIESMKWLEENMVKEFPIGVFIDKVG
jgi:2-oxoglutarate ferredoxin oxidoreductase subunit beta